MEPPRLRLEDNPPVSSRVGQRISLQCVCFGFFTCKSHKNTPELIPLLSHYFSKAFIVSWDVPSVETSPCLVLSALMSQLFPHRSHYICGREGLVFQHQKRVNR